MSDGWLDKAKQAALSAAEEAKKLAETAKNANYGEMLDKTKAMAQQATDEAKKAASSVSSSMSKPKAEGEAAAQIAPAAPVTPPVQVVAQTPTAPAQVVTPDPVVAAAPVMAPPVMPDKNLELCMAQLTKVEAMLQEIKALLKK